MTTNKKADDAIVKAAKSKLAKMIAASDKVEDVVSLCETLAKLKHVENEGHDEGWGSGLDPPHGE